MAKRLTVVSAIMVLLALPAAAADVKVVTGDPEIDKAFELAKKTLRMNISEKWGKLCPVLAPPWGQTYPAWIHPYDNFWMNKATPFVFRKDQVEWPIVLMSKYQVFTGMISWGIHDCLSPEETQKKWKEIGEEKLRKVSEESRYIRDHLFIMQVCDFWKHYGDADFARRLLPTCRKSFEYMYSFKDLDRDGLVESADIIEDVDVGSAEGRTGANSAERFVEQALLYGALVHYAEMTAAIGEKEDADLARARAAALREKVNDLYWNDKGYHIFAVDAKTHERLHEEVTSTYANGYGILWGLVPAERVAKVLDYLTGFEFEVPGPILLPPLKGPLSHGGKASHFPPGVYVNGGCGWGRGHMPSVTRALFENGRADAGTEYLRKMAKAANRDGAFYEYWQWEKYTGETKPGGAHDYSETASGFMDAVLKGYFGLAALEPGWRSLRFSPRPMAGKECSIAVDLPDGSFEASLKPKGDGWEVALFSPVKREVEVILGGAAPQRLTLQGRRTITVP